MKSENEVRIINIKVLTPIIGGKQMYLKTTDKKKILNIKEDIAKLFEAKYGEPWTHLDYVFERTYLFQSHPVTIPGWTIKSTLFPKRKIEWTIFGAFFEEEDVRMLTRIVGHKNNSPDGEPLVMIAESITAGSEGFIAFAGDEKSMREELCGGTYAIGKMKRRGAGLFQVIC